MKNINRAAGRFVAMLCALALCVAMVAQSAFAYETFSGKLRGGVYNRKYYIGCASSLYINPSVEAVGDWNWAVNSSNNGSGADVYFTRTYTSTEATFRFWGENVPTQTWTAITRHNNTNGSIVDPDSSNWTTADLVYNEALCPTSNQTKMRSIANHEFGHALGLAHVTSNVGVIMYPYWDTCTATVPTADDVAGVVSKYK